MKKIGVLSLQGGFKEHLDMIRKLGYEGIEIRKPKDIINLSGIILPGGESTAIGKLITNLKIKEVLIKQIKNGLPVWGTCAGMILLAKRIDNKSNTHLNLMDIRVKRNAYGSQLDSFMTMGKVHSISNEEIPMLFIRAPYITDIEKNVRILSRVDGNIVAARQDNMLVTSFHPELTKDTSFHSYFINKML